MLLQYALCAALTASLPCASAFAQERAHAKPIGILLAAGDIAECPEDLDRSEKKNAHARTGQATADLINREIARAGDIPVGVLALGDLAYPKGEKKSFDCFAKTWGAFAGKIFPVPGNHEYEKFSDAKPYFVHFEKTLASLNADKQHGYYAVPFPPGSTGTATRQPWLLIGLNSERLEENAKGNNGQLAWLERTLTETKDAPCVLAFSHSFIYGSGRYGHGDRKYNAKNPLSAFADMRAAFSLLYRHHASLLVSGHDHHFEQLGRANDKAEGSDAGASAMAKDGVRTFIVGTGGAYLYPNFSEKNMWAFTEAYALKDYGVLRIKLYPDRYSWKFISTVKDGEPASLQTVREAPRDKHGEQFDTCNRSP